MKIPRVKDFDPNAKIPTLKSSMDDMPVISKRDNLRVQGIPNTPEEKNNQYQSIIRDVLPVPPVRPVLSKRQMKHRWPIDIYQDQYEALKDLSLEERKSGGLGSMSAMIREALDKLIAEKKSGGK